MAAIHALETRVSNLETHALGRIAVLEGEVTKLQGWAIDASAELVKLAALTGLGVLTVAEIANLVRLAKNPCACFMPDGELAFLIPLTMANTWNSL
jgi:hypothetical protein